jgi:hypothetical protein
MLAEVSKRLGGRQLVWFGTRGDDIASISDLPQLAAAYSVISAYRGETPIEAMALEDVTGIRVDLDTHDIDEEVDREAVSTLRRAIMRTLARPSWVFTYRPSALVSAVCFARREQTRYLGLFKDHQSAFEHKPWVESSVADMGVPTIPWTYLVEEDLPDRLSLLTEGPHMVRQSRGSGGTGLLRVDSLTDVTWDGGRDMMVSVAPFVSGGTPVNIGATVWHDGVTVDLPSVQLIGVPSCTDRPFGYCGNDFGLMRDFSAATLDDIEASTLLIGQWLRRFGYLGTFGVDFLVKDDVPLFLEVNPRFQGSTHLSARLELEQGASCLVLEHLAANLGLDRPAEPPLRDRVAQLPDAAHMVIHRPAWAPAQLDPSALAVRASGSEAFRNVDVLTRSELHTQAGATVARLTVADRVTSDGLRISPRWDSLITTWLSDLSSAAPV